ncbi:MAG: aromatic ring-hydroxylating dioxygenase subunit alpha [Ktedonobacteraceae bacterium]
MTITSHPQTPFVSTLPGRYYYDPALYALEQERIFSTMWVCAGRAEALDRPGTYQTVDIGPEQVIVLRNKEHGLGAFLNVCRHRGARLCTEATGQLKGAIQCRYHAWTYGLDGRLIGAPNVLNDTAFDRDAFGLLPVALEVWEGLIWLNLSETPAPIAPQVNAPIIERFGSDLPFRRYGIGNLKAGKTLTYDIQANWKIVLENFMECYHCGPVHPEFCQILPGFKAGASYFETEAATFAEGVEAFSLTGKASRPPLPGLLPEDLRRYYGIVVVPNVLLNLVDDHVVIHTLYPQGPTQTHVTCDWLFDPQTMARPDFDPLDAVELFDIVNRQDWEVCELAQLGMSSKAFRAGGVYVPLERHISAFADFIRETLGA